MASICHQQNTVEPQQCMQDQERHCQSLYEWRGVPNKSAGSLGHDWNTAKTHNKRAEYRCQQVITTKTIWHPLFQARTKKVKTKPYPTKIKLSRLNASLKTISSKLGDIAVSVVVNVTFTTTYNNHHFMAIIMPSVLWHCWLGGRKDIQPVKNWLVGCWHGYLSGARCRLSYGSADAIATHCLLLQ